MGLSLVRDVLRRASFYLQDLSPQFKRWAQADLVGMLNDGQRVITTFVPTTAARMDVIKLRPGTTQSIARIAAQDIKYGDGGTPAATTVGTNLMGVYRNMGADGLTPGRPITIADRGLMDAQGSWHTHVGTFVRNFAMDPQFPTRFWVDPAPSVNFPVWVEVGYSAEPPLLGNNVDYAGDNTTIWLPDMYFPILVDYVVARANMIDNDYSDRSKAQEFQQSFMQALSAIVQAQTGTNPNMQRLGQLSFGQLAAAS
jgi:hypothetical protein